MSYDNKVVKGKGLTFRTKGVIEARYSLKGKEEDVFDMVLSKLEYDDNLRYCIQVKEFKEYYIDSNNIYRDIKKTVKNMEGLGANIYDETTRSEIFYPWFSKIRYVDKEGLIEVDMHPEMKEILLEEKKKIFMQMKYKFRLLNDYSKRRYDMVSSFKYSGWRVDTVEELCKKLKVPKSYLKKYSLFKTNVLKKTEEEINRVTDLKIVTIEEKEKNKVIRIKTVITEKSKEELKELELKFNKKVIDTNEISIEEPIRLQIEKMIEKIGDVDLNVKKELSQQFNLSIRSIERYILINSKLIKELKELLDLNFLSVSDCYKYVQTLSKEQQLKEFNSIKRRVNKFKLKLIPELVNAVETFKITYIQAEKYSEKDKEEQLKFYERKLIPKNKRKKKIKAIDVEYENVESIQSIGEEISVELDEKSNISKKINPIDKVREILYEFNISYKQAEVIYNNSNKNLEYIAYIFNEYNNNKKKILNPVAWISEMVKPNIYKIPELKYKPKLKFNNFTGRGYSKEEIDKLEKKLLGWDRIENEEEEAEENQFEISEKEKYNTENIEVAILEENKINVQDIKNTLSIMDNMIGKIPYNCWIDIGIDNVRIEGKIMNIICLNDLVKIKLEKYYNNLINEIIKTEYSEIEIINYEIKGA